MENERCERNETMKRLSLHVGLNYVNSSSYSGWGGRLACAVTDTLEMSQLFAGGGFEARVLLDEAATLANAVGELTLIADELVDGDACVLTYSGHGSDDPDVEDRQAFCLFDGELTDRKLHNLLERFKPGVRVVCVFDSCHSGGMNRGATRAKPHGVVAPRRTRAGTTAPLQSATVMLTACRLLESSVEGVQPWPANGAYTGALLAAFRTGQPWQAWHDRAAKAVTAANPFQTPMALELGVKTVLPADVMTFALSDAVEVNGPEMPEVPPPSA